MDRRSLLSQGTIAALGGLAAANRLAGGTAAQDATPAADAEETSGVVAEELSDARIAALPSAPAAFRLIRYRLAPDSALVSEASDTSVALVYVERGTVTAVVDAPVSISGGPQLGTPVAEIAAGVDFRLRPGDSFAFPPSAAGEIRNDGGRTAILLAAVIDSA